MHIKNKLHIKLILVLAIILITTLNASGRLDIEDSDSKLILLKSGYINTSSTIRSDAETDETANTNYSTQSVISAEKYYIVQFTGPVQEEWKQSIISKGSS